MTTWPGALRPAVSDLKGAHMSAANDYAAGGEAGYTGSYVDTGTAWGISEGDAAEWNKMTAFTAAPQQAEAAPWWANMVGYGITKAIDNTFPNQNIGIQGNTKPGSFAGQNHIDALCRHQHGAAQSAHFREVP